MSVRVSEIRHGQPYRNYTGTHYVSDKRIDVFKYSLASQSVLQPIVSKFIFYIELGDDVLHKKDEILSWVEELKRRCCTC